jgi:hypothetical protein
LGGRAGAEYLKDFLLSSGVSLKIGIIIMIKDDFIKKLLPLTVHDVAYKNENTEQEHKCNSYSRQ